MDEVSGEPDIMGSIRPEVESFYRRDEVVVIEETKLVHRLFFSDLVFTQNQRVTHVRWFNVKFIHWTRYKFIFRTESIRISKKTKQCYSISMDPGSSLKMIGLVDPPGPARKVVIPFTNGDVRPSVQKIKHTTTLKQKTSDYIVSLGLMGH